MKTINNKELTKIYSKLSKKELIELLIETHNNLDEVIKHYSFAVNTLTNTIKNIF